MHNRTPREGELFASAKICAAIGKGVAMQKETKLEIQAWASLRQCRRKQLKLERLLCATKFQGK